MLNLWRIQLELERAKEGLREVEETIQKVEGKSFPNGPGRYSSLKVQLHSDKNRNPVNNEDGKLQRRIIASNIEPKNRRISSDDLSFTLKRGPRDKRDSGVKRQGVDTRLQSVSTRLTGLSHQQTVDDEDDEEFTKKLSLPSRVITTAAEAPSRQEIIAAQTGDEIVKQRNRRMFGALVGTLQRFCKEETRVREREEKRLKVEKKLEEDAKREKEKLLQEKRELFLERKRREIEIKRIEWSLNRVKEYEAWEANVLPLKNFIQTHAKPHIFYLPSTHNSKTEERLAQSQKIVERMIEKRKNNLKEEIENSEKKARRTAAEEEEEEEAENIPQNSDSVQNVEQPVEIDFDTINKENGFHEEEMKTQKEEEVEDSNKNEETTKEGGGWSDKDTEGEEKYEEGSISENKVKNSPEGVEEPPNEEPGVSSGLCGASSEVTRDEGKEDDEGGSEGDGDGGGEERKNGGAESEAIGEGRTFETEEQATEPEKSESYHKVEDVAKDASSADATDKVPISESENGGKSPAAEKESLNAEEGGREDDDDAAAVATAEKPEEKALEEEKEEEKVKVEQEKQEEESGKVEERKGKESTKRKEESPGRKSTTTTKRSKEGKSPSRRSRSPRRFAKTRRRSRSTSRRRKSFRRRSKSLSKSVSPSKKSSRRARSPRPRRRSERGTFSSRRKSPHSRSRRRSSSKSSSSASPRKRMKFRSPSYSNSRSDSD